jgi:hypothetical protein
VDPLFRYFTGRGGIWGEKPLGADKEVKAAFNTEVTEEGQKEHREE